MKREKRKTCVVIRFQICIFDILNTAKGLQDKEVAEL